MSTAIGLEAVGAALCDGVFDAVAPERCAVALGTDVVGERQELVPSHGPTVTHELPLEVGARRIGTLAITFTADRTVTDDERGFLDACAAAGATALRRADLFSQIQHQALHDPLTGLPNWLLLKERLDHLIARAHRNHERFAVVVVGLDDFKLVNDTRGHAVGNEVLTLVAARLSGAVRETDLVARAGGDEFVVVYADLGSETESDLVAQRLQDTFAAPVSTSDGEVFLRASIGVVAVDSTADDAERVLSDADVALLDAKRSAAATHVRFDSTMRERVRERASVEQELRVALARTSSSSTISRSSRRPTAPSLDGGARALGASHPRTRVAGGLHPGGRGLRADRRRRPARAGTPPAGSSRSGERTGTWANTSASR